MKGNGPGWKGEKREREIGLDRYRVGSGTSAVTSRFGNFSRDAGHHGGHLRYQSYHWKISKSGYGSISNEFDRKD
jgi:hypothetical protein